MADHRDVLSPDLFSHGSRSSTGRSDLLKLPIDSKRTVRRINHQIANYRHQIRAIYRIKIVILIRLLPYKDSNIRKLARLISFVVPMSRECMIHRSFDLKSKRWRMIPKHSESRKIVDEFYISRVMQAVLILTRRYLAAVDFCLFLFL